MKHAKSMEKAAAAEISADAGSGDKAATKANEPASERTVMPSYYQRPSVIGCELRRQFRELEKK